MISDLTIRFRGAGAAVGAGDRVGWNGFGQLVPLLASRDVSLIGGKAAWQLCAKWYAVLACREGK